MTSWKKKKTAFLYCCHLISLLPWVTEIPLKTASFNSFSFLWLIFRVFSLSEASFYSLLCGPLQRVAHMATGCSKWQRTQNEFTTFCKLILVLMPHHLLYSLEVTQSSLHLRWEDYPKAWILGGRDPWGPS